MTHVPTGTTSGLQYYPRRYWSASSTFHNWNKLTAEDVHSSLGSLPGFEGQNVYFYLNHPIQYVRVVGVVVDIEAIARGKYVLLTLDDGSGKCLTVKIDVRKQGEEAEFPSNTTVNEVIVRMSLGLVSVTVCDTKVGIGSILKAKGTLSTFRDSIQMDLKRVSMVRDTNEEAACWAETARWRREIMSRAWLLTDEQKASIDEDVRKDLMRKRAKQEKKQEQVKLKEKLKLRARLRGERKEDERRKEAEKLNEGALGGSSNVRAPWD